MRLFGMNGRECIEYLGIISLLIDCEDEEDEVAVAVAAAAAAAVLVFVASTSLLFAQYLEFSSSSIAPLPCLPFPLL